MPCGQSLATAGGWDILALMVDTSLREQALLIAMRIVELSDPEPECDVLDELLTVADRLLEWLTTPVPAVRLVLSVGPVTEQPSS